LSPDLTTIRRDVEHDWRKQKMKILALLGSPRKDGNTRTVLDLILQSAAEAGAETEVVVLSDLKNITGCHECHGCQATEDEPGCVVQDDLQPVLTKMVEADLVVWATPVFCWAPSWLIKIPMDRSFCLFKFSNGIDSVRCLLAGHKMAAVITAGGGEDDGATSVEETCRRMAEFSQTEWRGAFIAANAESPEAIHADADLLERAKAFGRKLAS
jgi:multimeric flavodoxin WrbA